MALLENRIEIDLGEGTIFELSESTKKTLGPPEGIARQLDARPGERGVPELEEGFKEQPEVVKTTNAKAFQEVELVLDAAQLMATPPSGATMERLKRLVGEDQPDTGKQ